MAAPNRSEMIGVRVRPREMALVRTAADLEGVTVAEFVRERLLPDARAIVSGEGRVRTSERARK